MGKTELEHIPIIIYGPHVLFSSADLHLKIIGVSPGLLLSKKLYFELYP